MNKKTIVLADNSYTIRRIVELSFSEEEGIELISFENSLNLREKLLELKPAIVLVDIKLPEFNGYDVCKFVNSTESLKHTHVFLLKGGFEPVDENLLKGLRFVDIITKPFDSNALVSTIKKLLQEKPAAAPPPPSVSVSTPGKIPSSIPEDIPEIDGIPEAAEEINFSDIKQEIDSNDIIATHAGTGSPEPPDEEVLPSEEITQGAQPERDSLAPTSANVEDLDNPFKEETAAKESVGSITDEELAIKKNIEAQERELEIGSLTQEEINIKKMIGEREKELAKERFGKDETPGVESEPPSDLVSEFFDRPTSTSPMEDVLKFDKPKEKEVTEIPDLDSIKIDQQSEPETKEIPDLETSEIEKEMGLGADIPEPPSTRKIEEPPIDTQAKAEETPDIGPDYQPPSPFEEKAEPPPYEPPPVVEEPVVEIPPMETEAPTIKEETPQEKLKIPAPPTETEKPPIKVEPEIPPVEEKTKVTEPVEPEKKDIPSIQKEEILNRVEDKLSAAIKEVLWEIVPPLAEKIITKEIEDIKAEVSKSSK